MRIGMMVDVYKPYVSGVTNCVSLSKRVLEAMGHKVFVFTFGNDDYEDEELNVVRTPGLPLTLGETGFHLSFRYSRAAQRKLRTMDVIHVHHPFLSGPLALRYAARGGLPVVFTNHTRYDLYAQHYLPPFIPDAVQTTFLQTYLPSFCERCSLVIAPSAGVKCVLRDLGVNSPVKVIPNGIDLTPFANPPRVLRRSDVGLSDDSVVLMYLGRFGPEKRLSMLLKAFFEVAAALPDVVLALVGDGPERAALRVLAQQSEHVQRIKFLGKVDYADVPVYLRLADAFVSASDSEVHPLSLIEAMAAGLPAVGVDSPGVADTIVDGENGLLSRNDLPALAERVRQLASDAALRQRLAQGALASAKLYDINRTAALALAEYEHLAATSVHERRLDQRSRGEGRR